MASAPDLERSLLSERYDGDANRSGLPFYQTSASAARHSSRSGVVSSPTTGRLGKTSKTHIESFDFDPNESYVHQQALRRLTQADHKKRALFRWVFIFLIAVVTALIAVLITYCTRKVTAAKFNTFYHVIEKEKAMDAAKGTSFLVLLAFTSGYAVLAAMPVAYLCPVAAGSGISEIKCILNGVKIPRAVRIKTLCVKVWSIVWSVGSGLPVGKEGPMIHSGAIVAAGLSQGKSTTMGFDTRWSRFQDFRNDREKRDFVVCGAGAGVAAAFGAPVGGLLFSLEEGASFWFQSLTWRTFFCAMVSTYLLDVFLSGINAGTAWGHLSTPGMFSFGDFTSTGQNKTTWTVYEIPFFAVLGVAGGVIGAGFNHVNLALSRWRRVHAATPARKVAAVVSLVVLSTVIFFFVPYIFGRCIPRPINVAPSNARYAAELVTFYCGEGNYNQLASLLLLPSEDVIKQLFHLTATDFEVGPLVFFWVFYSALTCVTYGSAIASGLFIPSLCAGSAMGRLLGQALQAWLPGKVVDPGTYSLIGAAAMLGGMARMTVSLAVILLESTGDYQYGLPIMLTLLLARWTGNAFNEGLYDAHIHLNKWPLLEEHAKKAMAAVLSVANIMTPAPTCLREVERVGTVMEALLRSSHHGFPVIRGPESEARNRRVGRLAGLVYRRHVCTLLQHRCFAPNKPRDYVTGQPRQWGEQDLLSWETLERSYPRYPLPETFQFTEADRRCWLDLRPYTNLTPYVVKPTAPVIRAYHLFRTLGLRHVLVADDCGDCVGIVTRTDLTHEALSRVRRTTTVQDVVPPVPLPSLVSLRGLGRGGSDDDDSDGSDGGDLLGLSGGAAGSGTPTTGSRTRGGGIAGGGGDSADRSLYARVRRSSVVRDDDANPNVVVSHAAGRGPGAEVKLDAVSPLSRDDSASSAEL